MRKTVALAYGDGIGPEIMSASIAILQEAGVPIDFQEIKIGESVYLSGEPAGISQDSWQILKNTDAFYKAPITTPQGGGFKSLNVTVRATLGLYANLRPCQSFMPYIASKHPNMNVLIVRENEEDLYAGIEYRPSQGTTQAVKLITVEACERIIRYAFETTQIQGRKKVSCFSKDNILKISDGLFHEVFNEISKEYPSIESDHWIIDIGAAKLADTPENFDVIVCANLYGDILSDIAAQIAGSVGLAGSANIGKQHAMFEAIHGSAPRRAGQNLANPTGLLMGGIMMLEHLELFEQAKLVYNAWAKTIEDGIHTYDIFNSSSSKKKVGTKEFTQEIINRLGQTPLHLSPKIIDPSKKCPPKKLSTRPVLKKTLNGVDISIESSIDPKEIARVISDLIEDKKLTLDGIANRGVWVWPKSHSATSLSDLFRCRILSEETNFQDRHSLIQEIMTLLKELEDKKIDICQVQYLFNFDGKPAYSPSQHQQ